MGQTEKAMAPHSNALAWKIPWTEEPGGLQSMGSLRVGHDWATSISLFFFSFTFHFHALEKEMATHSSVLAWRIPGTGKPGRLPSMGSHRIGHDWSDLAAAAVGQKDVNRIWRHYRTHFLLPYRRMQNSGCARLSVSTPRSYTHIYHRARRLGTTFSRLPCHLGPNVTS